MSDSSIYDPSREETEAAAEVLAEAMHQPCDGYWMSVAEDQLRAAARVRGHAVEVRKDVFALVPDSDDPERERELREDSFVPLERVGAVQLLDREIAAEQAFDRAVQR